eukprot:TRINITY_DN3002_c0_g2_i1.p1 TRINITY_DN3002_c0_g2~~TRINITY_DN3002_c0_g2_i1.p1  ORF type:complete len:779 (-),score=156.02 TRINITY_DN3002_c0_g2_i1:18-2354(-)
MEKCTDCGSVRKKPTQKFCTQCGKHFTVVVVAASNSPSSPKAKATHVRSVTGSAITGSAPVKKTWSTSHAVTTTTASHTTTTTTTMTATVTSTPATLTTPQPGSKSYKRTAVSSYASPSSNISQRSQEYLSNFNSNPSSPSNNSNSNNNAHINRTASAPSPPPVHNQQPSARDRAPTSPQPQPAKSSPRTKLQRAVSAEDVKAYAAPSASSWSSFLSGSGSKKTSGESRQQEAVSSRTQKWESMAQQAADDEQVKEKEPVKETPKSTSWFGFGSGNQSNVTKAKNKLDKQEAMSSRELSLPRNSSSNSNTNSPGSTHSSCPSLPTLTTTTTSTASTTDSTTNTTATTPPPKKERTWGFFSLSGAKLDDASGTGNGNTIQDGYKVSEVKQEPKKDKPPKPPKPPKQLSRSGDLSKPNGDAGEKLSKEEISEKKTGSLSPDAKMRQKMRVGIRAAIDMSKVRYPVRSVHAPDFTEEDFGLKNTFSLKGKDDAYVFREYAPRVFHVLRSLFGFSEDDFVKSVLQDELQDLGFGGRSGAFLYITADNQFVIKTMPTPETKFLRRILKSYYEHMSSGQHSLLTKYLGMYRIRLAVLDHVSFIVMRNVFANAKEINERYDLKGSSVGRQTLFSCEMDTPLSSVTLKDLDLVNRFRIRLGNKRKASFVTTLTADAAFLERFGIIDYSLLLGVHFVGSSDGPGPAGLLHPDDLEMADGGIYASNDSMQPLKAIYYCAVIDILQPYTKKKLLEHNMKALVYDKDGISVCDPAKYAARFLSFISHYIE